MTGPELELDHGRVLLAGTVFVYLERTLAGDEPASGETPARSYGLAPTALTDAGEVYAALFPGEAVWLGFEAVDRARPVTLRVRAEGGPPLDATVPPDHALPRLFTRGEISVVTTAPEPGQALIRLLEPGAFTVATGTEPEPLDPGHGFGGWRLP